MMKMLLKIRVVVKSDCLLTNALPAPPPAQACDGVVCEKPLGKDTPYSCCKVCRNRFCHMGCLPSGLGKRKVSDWQYECAECQINLSPSQARVCLLHIQKTLQLDPKVFPFWSTGVPQR